MQIDKVQLIKSQLAMNDILMKYGYEPNKAKFICCPFHNERTPSMKIYEKDYHCFGCGAHGDIITFVQKLFSLSFLEALQKIDLDFNLGLYGKKSFEELRKSYYQSMALKAKKEREKTKREQADNEYWALFDEWKRLDDNKRKYAPKSPNEELHPLFIEALNNLSYQKYLLDCADEKRDAL